jgi:hypothetical protein
MMFDRFRLFLSAYFPVCLWFLMRVSQSEYRGEIPSSFASLKDKSHLEQASQWSSTISIQTGGLP